MSFTARWREVFYGVIRQHELAEPLREASRKASLRTWTSGMTHAVVEACQRLDWQATARGHKLDVMPVHPSEYLALDVMAFESGLSRWRFPLAVFELENGRDDRIAYSLWKVLCVRCQLRVVIGYRRTNAESASLVRFLRDDVLSAMNNQERMQLAGETLILTGSREDAEAFPFGFFKWWLLQKNTGNFEIMK